LQLSHFYEFGAFRLDVTKRRLYRGDEEVMLSPKEFDLLVVLLESRGRVLEKEHLLDLVWSDVMVEENTLTVAISRLRGRLAEPEPEQYFIETVPKRGYRFLADVRLVEEEEPDPIIERRSRVLTTHDEAGESAVVAGAGNGSNDGERLGLETDAPSMPPRRAFLPSPILMFVVALLLISLLGVIVITSYRARLIERSTSPERLAIVPFSGLPGRELYPDFSPEGNRIAFSWNGGAGGAYSIYVKLIGEGTPLRLTRNAADDFCPAWSPDGNYIAFIRFGQTGTTVLLIPALGGPERTLMIGGLQLTGLSWLPDGKWLLLGARLEEGGPARILKVSVETGEKLALTDPPPPSSDGLPSASPDGRQIAFIRDYDIYLTSINGGEVKRLTMDSRPVGRIAWTADSRDIVYDSGRIGNRTLWRIPASGGEPKAILSSGADYGSPAISRQGSRLAFVESNIDSNIGRLEMPSTTKGVRQVKVSWETMSKFIVSQREDDNPQYSPDGSKIAFVSNRSGSVEIWVCGSEGGVPLQITHAGGATAGSPRWSPDSRSLAYDSHPGRYEDVFVISADGGVPRRLTTDTSNDILPNWSGDGAWIYFCSDRTGSNQIWKMPSEGGPATQVTRKGGFEAVEATDGKTLYYSKGYVNGLWTVPVSGGEERPVPELARAGEWRSWTITRDGICFVSSEGSSAPRPLKFFSFATRQITQLGLVDVDPLKWTPGLAISPDGRWLLYARLDRDIRSILLVESFH